MRKQELVSQVAKAAEVSQKRFRQRPWLAACKAGKALKEAVKG